MSGLHVAIIMDGNGRWARAQGKPRWRGHLAGVDSVRNVVRAAPDLGVRVLTLYAFSSDNWKRPAMEVGRLFWLLRRYCIGERDELVANGVRVTAIGRRDRIPASALRALEQLERDTAEGTKLHLRLAIDYSSRAAIAEAVRTLAQQVAEGRLTPAEMTEQKLDHIVTGGVAQPDLLIRTAGERRLSDFLLWEVAYTELYFSPTAWPAFHREHLAEALADFRRRERRFGAVPATREERQVAVV
ncbi:MAG: di-trans,poly-cis-decaprenylcistransferase [Gemmatimonadetes bacterium]|nr:di-trans,poly-cis-decaprenylcistransferase [Gemmatimonadota bacterium]